MPTTGIARVRPKNSFGTPSEWVDPSDTLWRQGMGRIPNPCQDRLLSNHKLSFLDM